MTQTPTRPVLRYHGGKWRLERTSRTFSDSGKLATVVLWISPNVPARQHELFREGDL